MASPALPGLLFCFAAMVLLVLATVSVPIWNKWSLLDAVVQGKAMSFGVFGYTGSAKMLGYSFDQSTLGFNDSRISASTFHGLTYVFVLHPVGAGLAAIACLFGLCGAGYSRGATILMALSAAVATLVTMIAWVIDMVVFSFVKNAIISNGGTAQYGDAIWFTLGAFVSLMLAFCAGVCGSCGRFRHNRSYEEKM